MDPPSAFGKFSAFAVEIRLQIWHELLCEPVKPLSPMWFLRARDALGRTKDVNRIPFDVAIFQSSKACGLEAMEVFYSAEHVFSFCALPSRGELEYVNEKKKVAQFIRDYMKWMPVHPTKFAAGYIKNVRISISIRRRTTDCFGQFQMSDYSLCIPLTDKLQISDRERGQCLIDLVFYGTHMSSQNIQVLAPPFFRGLRTLTTFKKISIRSSCSRNPAYLTLEPNLNNHWYRYTLNHCDAPLRDYTEKRIVEELRQTLGVATILTKNKAQILEFSPSTRLSNL